MKHARRGSASQRRRFSGRLLLQSRTGPGKATQVCALKEAEVLGAAALMRLAGPSHSPLHPTAQASSLGRVGAGADASSAEGLTHERAQCTGLRPEPTAPEAGIQEFKASRGNSETLPQKQNKTKKPERKLSTSTRTMLPSRLACHRGKAGHTPGGLEEGWSDRPQEHEGRQCPPTRQPQGLGAPTQPWFIAHRPPRCPTGPQTLRKTPQKETSE